MNNYELYGPPLPEPLSAKDWDLSGDMNNPMGSDRMPLVGRLFHSHFFFTSSAEGFRAALTLWWHAWKDCPVGSMTSDDEVLCRLTGLKMRKWLSIKTEALHGFVLCSDGKYYHPFVVKLAWEEFTTNPRFRKRWKLLQQKRATAPPIDPTNVTSLKEWRRG